MISTFKLLNTKTSSKDQKVCNADPSTDYCSKQGLLIS